MRTRTWLRLLVVSACFAAACSGSSKPPANPTPTPTPTPTPSPTPTPVVATLVGAGDIADCTAQLANDGAIHAEATAKLIDSIPDAKVFTAGDDAYFNGTAAEFNNCYGPRWGRFKGRTRPSAGNHEYEPLAGGPYYDYFGGSAGDRGTGYYSYTWGNWHIVSLNSNIDAGAASAQVRWLDGDLAANKISDTARCTLAYWHHPLFTSGPSAGSNGKMRDVWQKLYEYGVDVVVNGHDHLYERFGPQDFIGRPDAPAGITEYIVGTGGVVLYQFGPILPNSRFRTNSSWGVIKFTLRDVGWDSVFIDATTGLLIDNSIGNLCH
jgi:acid phosphatase type 7